MSYVANGFRSVASTMVRSALVFAVGAFALLAGPADAAPLTSSKSAISQSDETVLTLVRDGCGRGMRFSNRRQTCVEDFGGGGPRFVEPGCPRGMRFSNSRQACVPAGGGVDPGTAIIQGIIGGVVGAPGCGPGMRWSNSRQACVWR